MQMTKGRFRGLFDLISECLTEKQQRAVTCAILGHSKVVRSCFGQVTCCRCEAIVGDSLAGAWSPQGHLVLVGVNQPEVDQPATTTWSSLGWTDFENLPKPAYEAARTIKPRHSATPVQPLKESSS